MNKLYFIHALDDTTSFLNIFKEYFRKNFFTIEPNEKSVAESIEFLKQIPDDSLVIFLGHGHSSGLYTPEDNDFKKYTFIDSIKGNELFNNKNIILLSCRSSEFGTRITNANQFIGFGNIISSVEEIAIEAELESGIYRDLDTNDIKYFNDTYCIAIINALKNLEKGLYAFNQIPKLIEFFVNQQINATLLNKELKNRVEIAKLLFEFRNEMIYRAK